MKKKELIEYFEHVRYQVACFPQSKMTGLPLFSGSGFMLELDGHVIFITAGHVATTHKDGTFVDDKLMAIQTNTVYKNAQTNRYECLLITVGGVVSVSAFRVDPQTGSVCNLGVVDVSFAELNGVRKDTPCHTQMVTLDGADVKSGELKSHISSNDIIQVSNDDCYSVYGRVHLAFNNVDGQYVLNSELIFHTDLKYIGDYGDYNVLQYDKPIIIKDWKGLSGCPVLNQDGKLIGVACSIDPIANTLYVMPMRKIMPLIQADIQTGCKN